MVLVAPRSAKLVEARGARFTLLCGYAFLLLAFGTMLLLWEEGSPYWKVGLAYVFIGIGVGFAGTPASHSLTGSVPVRRAGMASGTADLQRDLGGAIMQSIFGALLTAGYARPPPRRSPAPRTTSRSTTASRTSSRSRSPAPKPPRSSTRRRESDHRGGQAVVPRRRRLGVHRRPHRRAARRGARVLPLPKREAEERLLEQYHAEDTGQPELDRQRAIA